MQNYVNNSSEDQRIAVLHISGEMLVEVISAWRESDFEDARVKCTANYLPDDVSVRLIDSFFGEVVVLLHSRDFARVPPGCTIPRLDPPRFERYTHSVLYPRHEG